MRALTTIRYLNIYQVEFIIDSKYLNFMIVI